MNMQIALMCWQWLINKRLPRFNDSGVQSLNVLLIGVGGVPRPVWGYPGL